MPSRKTPKIPPCPDPDRYTLIITKEGTAYWRLKRGFGKPALLNSGMEDQGDRMKRTMPAARHIINSLGPYLVGITIGRTMVRIGSLLTRELKDYDTINFSSLKGFEFHKEAKVDSMFRGGNWFEIDGDTIRFILNMAVGGAVRKNWQVADSYQFQLIILSGNPLEEGPLAVHAMSSEVFTYDVSLDSKEVYTLDIDLPTDDDPWMLLLKVITMEDGRIIPGPHNTGMVVVATGADGKALL